ncbi:hypothetical protein HPB49_008856 [Dermacentor silvarum]|uniref:Uncharacterized protein n=1 Tax=Dermacentor silvarum TaxID=543639 RepID=A0ACB8DBW3_DERSI|nr:uncharacterized protein LOC119441254 [Dermacentor silvarum]KAH7965592.1 hypothetical protein HPB49_008856 [Dermacentor silvarum]
MDAPASPDPSAAPTETTTTRHVVPLALLVNKQHSTSDVGPVPEHIMQLCKSITNEQLISKLSKHRPLGRNLVLSINEVGSQMSLPGFPRNDTCALVSSVLPFFTVSQKANENLNSKNGHAEVLSFEKTNVKNACKMPLKGSSSDDKQHRLRSTAKQQDIISSEVHTLTAEEECCTGSVDTRFHPLHKRSGRPSSCSPQSLGNQGTEAGSQENSGVQDTVAAKVKAAVSGETEAVVPVHDLAKLDMLSLEEISPCHSPRHQSPVQKRMGKGSKDNERHSHVTEWLCNVPLPAALTAIPGQSQKQPSVNPHCPQGIADSDSDATDMEGPVLQQQPQQNGSQLPDQDKSSLSLLHSSPNKAQRSLPSLSQASSEGVHKKGLSVRFAAPIQKETAEQLTDKQVLPAATVSETFLLRHQEPSPLGVQEPRLSKSSSKGVQDLPQGAQKRIVRSVSPDVLVPLKKRKVPFTALQEEALVYGVMKYGRGSWKEISNDGWFDGRRPTDLSDKYRNLEKYGHLANVTKKVKDMLSAGINPLKELRTRYERQRQQHVVSPVGGESSNSERSTMGQPEKPHRASLLLKHPKEDRVVPSSGNDDNVSLKPFQKPTEVLEATTMPKTVCSSTSRPSTSQAHTSALGKLSSESEENASQESAPTKLKNKKRRVPFTPLEEEALVAGVLKYGKGNWARILREGGFLGRTSLQLSDKYRNLKLYRQLEALENTVNTKCARGEDPLEELQKLFAAHWKC